MKDIKKEDYENIIEMEKAMGDRWPEAFGYKRQGVRFLAMRLMEGECEIHSIVETHDECYVAYSAFSRVEEGGRNVTGERSWGTRENYYSVFTDVDEVLNYLVAKTKRTCARLVRETSEAMLGKLED